MGRGVGPAEDSCCLKQQQRGARQHRHVRLSPEKGVHVSARTQGGGKEECGPWEGRGARTGGRWRKAEEGCHARGGECARIEAAAVSELPRRGVAEGQSSTTMARRAGERLGGAGGAAVSPGREGRGEEERGGTGERLGGADDAPGPAPAPTACSGREGRGDDGRDGSEPLGDCEPRVMRSSIAAKHAKATGQGVGSSASFLRDMANVEGWIGRIVTRWRLHK
jgi:hypothetical protein